MKHLIVILCLFLASCSKPLLHADDIHYADTKFDKDIIVAFRDKSSLSIKSVEYNIITELKASGAFNNVYLFNSRSFDKKNDELFTISYSETSTTEAISALNTANHLATIATLGVVPSTFPMKHRLDVLISTPGKPQEHYLYELDEESQQSILTSNKSTPQAIAKYFVSELMDDLSNTQSLPK